MLIGFGIGGAGGEDLGIVRLGERVGFRDQLVGKPLLAQLALGHIFGVAAQHDIRAAARHVRRDGDGAQMAGLRDDLGFFFVVLGVQNVVGNALALEHLRQKLRLFNRDRADQHWLALFVAFLDLPDDRAVFAGFGLIDDIRVVDTDDGLVCRDLHDVQIVDAGEFLLLGQRRAGHAGELVVQAEEILEGDGGERLVLARDLDALLGLNGLMQALVIPAAVHQSAGELVDDDDLSVLDDIVDVALHETTGLHGLIDVVRERGVFRVGEVLDAEELLRLCDALLREGDGAVLFIDNVVAVELILQLLVVSGWKRPAFSAARRNSPPSHRAWTIPRPCRR